MIDYLRGFEDACELILEVVKESDSISCIEDRTEYLLAIVKEDKQEELKKWLGIY